MRFTKQLACKSAALLLLVAPLLLSCGEEDDTEEEFQDWRSRNETYFQNTADSVKRLIASGRVDWLMFKTWQIADDYATGDITDTILVEVLTEGEGSGYPLYNDSIQMHYQMRLLPSKSYSEGYVFDQSYYGTYSPETSVPSDFLVSSTVEGVATALQHMRIGDRWRVIIPWQQGYGSSATSSIPAYSTLFADITLVAYTHSGTALPVWKTRGNTLANEE